MRKKLQRAERLARTLNDLCLQKQQQLQAALANLEEKRQIEAALADVFDRGGPGSPEFAPLVLRRLAAAAAEIPKAETAVIDASRSFASLDLQLKRAGHNRDVIKADIERALAEREIQEALEATRAMRVASTVQAKPPTFTAAAPERPGNTTRDTNGDLTD